MPATIFPRPPKQSRRQVSFAQTDQQAHEDPARHDHRQTRLLWRRKARGHARCRTSSAQRPQQSGGEFSPNQTIIPERLGHPKANSPPWKATNFRRATETHCSSRVSARVAITVTISWGVVSLRKSTVRSSSMRVAAWNGARRVSQTRLVLQNDQDIAVAQQHVEDAVLGERAAELGETEIQGSRRWRVLPTFA